MLFVGAVTLLFWATLFHLENQNSERAVTSHNLHALSDDDPRERLMAAQNLYNVAEEDLGRTLIALLGAMHDVDWRVRQASAHSLVVAIEHASRPFSSDLTEEVEIATPALLVAFQDPNGEVRAEVVGAVGRLHPLSRHAALKDPSGTAIKTDADSKALLQRLSMMMKDPEISVRIRAVTSYATIASDLNEPTRPILDMIDNDPSIIVRTAAIRDLGKYWRDQFNLYPVILREIRRAKNPEERQGVAWMLGDDNFGFPNANEFPALRDALALEDPIVRLNAPRALAKLGQVARPALPALLPLARGELAQDLYALPATEAILAIDPDSPEAHALFGPLVASLGSPERKAGSVCATELLLNCGKWAAPAVPDLVGLLKGSQPMVRERAARVLGAIGPDAKEAAPAIEALARAEEDPGVRMALENALKSIHKD